MKKILATILALVMAIGVTTMAWATETAAAAEVADATALAEAIEKGGEIKLTKDITASITIASGKTVTLDLNGCTLTNEAGQHTITNNGTLTIVDTSAAKSGTVDNVSHGKGALYNNVGAAATLNGGTFTRSKENGQSKEESGGNSWYTIKNFGTMIIDEGTEVNQTGNYSSLLANGWQSVGSAGEPAHTADAVLTIKGGTFKGGLNTIKNDDCGQLTINGGIFENYTQAAFMNHNDATVNGGKFTATGAEYAIYNCGCAAGNDIGKLTISGGEFSGNVAIRSVGALDNISISGGTFAGTIVKDKADSKITVSGGTYTVDVSEYAGTTAVASLNGTYYVGTTDIGKAVESMGTGDTLTVVKGTVKIGNSEYTAGVNATYTVPPRYYYNSTTTTDTKKADNKGTSPKTFDAGVGIYAVSAVLSVTGMAYVGKKKF